MRNGEENARDSCHKGIRMDDEMGAAQQGLDLRNPKYPGLAGFHSSSIIVDRKFQPLVNVSYFCLKISLLYRSKWVRCEGHISGITFIELGSAKQISSCLSYFMQ